MADREPIHPLNHPSVLLGEFKEFMRHTRDILETVQKENKDHASQLSEIRAEQKSQREQMDRTQASLTSIQSDVKLLVDHNNTSTISRKAKITGITAGVFGTGILLAIATGNGDDLLTWSRHLLGLLL